MSFESFNDCHQDFIIDNNQMELFKMNNNNKTKIKYSSVKEKRVT